MSPGRPSYPVGGRPFPWGPNAPVSIPSMDCTKYCCVLRELLVEGRAEFDSQVESGQRILILELSRHVMKLLWCAVALALLLPGAPSATRRGPGARRAVPWPEGRGHGGGAGGLEGLASLFSGLCDLGEVTRRRIAVSERKAPPWRVPQGTDKSSKRSRFYPQPPAAESIHREWMRTGGYAGRGALWSMAMLQRA